MTKRLVTVHERAQAEFGGGENSSVALAQALIQLAASSAVLHGAPDMGQWNTVKIERGHGDEPRSISVTAASTVEYL